MRTPSRRARTAGGVKLASGVEGDVEREAGECELPFGDANDALGDGLEVKREGTGGGVI